MIDIENGILAQSEMDTVNNNIRGYSYMRYIGRGVLEFSTLAELRELKTAFNAQRSEIKDIKEALNLQVKATETLISLLTKIEENTNPDPKVNTPSKRVDMNR